MRRAQLMAEAVACCCPWCGEPQPNKDGSEMWTREDFARKYGIHECVSCEKEFVIAPDSRASFR